VRQLLADIYPDSDDVLAAGLGGHSDEAVWARAKAHGFVLVSKDEDFQRMSVLRGHPPKVIWIRLGNCASADVARLLRFRLEHVRAFVGDAESAFLALG